MRILVCGKRPAATALTAILANAGADAFLCDSDGEFLSRVESGFRLEHEGEQRDFAVSTTARGLEGVYDIICLAAAAADMDSLLRLLSPHVHRHTLYLDVTGNLGSEHIGEMVGPERVTTGVPGWAGEWTEEGRRARLEGRGLCLEEPPETGAATHEQFIEVLAATSLGPVRVAGSCRDELWASLCYTIPLDSLGAILGLDYDSLVETAGLPDIVLKASGEVRDVARAMGYQLDALHDWSALKENENGGRQEAAVKNFFAHARGLPSSRVQSPLRADLEAGRLTDNRWLAGYVAERGRSLAIGTPANNTISTVIREMERGKRRPSPDNLRELTRRIGEDDSMFLT